MLKDKASVYDIIESMQAVLRYVRGKSFEQFQQDEQLIDAVIRRMEIIGEATKRLSSRLRQSYPQIPWQQMAGMRDRLIHGYHEVELPQIWHAVTEIVPLLLPQLQSILTQIPDPLAD
ncbi:HepT-like ribonuclease domain-containing protein [Fontivita pretiosa]|jgi:uncharacterized protein with HEPN domain|uniref:HepT-like ribonuclease domain-containing protein n=1 Tax=Fontivita pretiosa TaxID=2989684 RepID=UPI003D17E89F